MKLTDRIILRELESGGSTFFKVDSSSGIGKGRKLEGVLCLDPDTVQKGIPVLEEGMIYILQEKTLLKMLSSKVWFPDNILLIILKEDTGERISKIIERLLADTPVIRIAGDDCWMSVVNEIFRIIRRFENWESHLEDLRSEYAPVEDLLYDSLDILKNPLILFRDDLSIRAEVTKTPLPDSIRFWRIKDPQKQIERLNEILQDPYLGEQMKSRGTVYRGPEETMGIRSLMYNVVLDQRISYILCVPEYEKPLDGADEDLLEMLAEQVRRQLILLGENSSRRVRHMEQILTRLLREENCDYEQLSRDLARIGWKKEQKYLCLVLEMCYPDNRKLPVGTVCGSLEEKFRDCCSFALDEKIVTFFNLTNCGKTQEEIAFELSPFIRDSLLKAGYSREISGLEYIRQLYVQAGAALQIGSRKAPHIWIHQFDTYALDYLLEQMRGDFSGELLCHPGLLLLCEYDRNNDSQYVQTLYTYLKNNQNAVRSAKELYIHRSTFLYRLEKIREIVRCNFDDPEEVLYLQLSFFFLDRSDGNPAGHGSREEAAESYIESFE